jgi:hypothetical protein
MNRLFVSFATLMLFGASSAMAAPEVVLSTDDGSKKLKLDIDADGERVATFAYGKDIWLVFTGSENPKMTVPMAVRKQHGLVVQESLDSPQGSGVRFSFSKKPNVDYNFSRVLGGAPESDVRIDKQVEGVEISGVADARFVSAYSPALKQSYTVLPMSALQATTSQKFGDILQRPAKAGRVFVSNKEQPLRSLYQSGRYYMADNTNDLLAMAELGRVKDAAAQTIGGESPSKEVVQELKVSDNPKEDAEVAPKPKGASKQTAGQLALAKELGVADVRLETEKSKIVLNPPQEKVDIVPAETVPAVEEPVVTQVVQLPDVEDKSENLTSTQFKPLSAVSDAISALSSVGSSAKTPAENTSLVSKILKDETPKEKADALPTSAYGPKDESNEELTSALSVVEGALAGLKSLYTPSDVTTKKGSENPESIVAVKEETAGYSDEFFGDDSQSVAKADKKNMYEGVFDENIAAITEMPDEVTADDLVFMAKNVLGDVVETKEIGTDEVWDEEHDSVSDLIVTLEDGPLFVRAIDAPYMPNAKVGDLHEDSYLYKHNAIMEELGQSFSRVKRDRVRLQLAKLALAYGRPEETLSYIDYMPRLPSNDALPQAEDARMLGGVANIMLGRADEAYEYLNEPTENYEKDRKLWLAITYEALGDPEKATELLLENIEQARQYPNSLLKEVYFAYGRALLRLERVSELKELMRDLSRYLPRSELPPEALLLLARANLVEGNDREAETLLARVAGGEPSAVSFLAQYEFVRFLLNKGDIGLGQAVGHLERLRYLWRGGEVEERILDKLGRMYLAQGEHRLGLERLKQHNVYYPESAVATDTTSLMTSSFKELFLDDTAFTKMDDLAILGIYYDFRELTPPGIKGDDLIRKVAQRLKFIGLFDRASSILEEQLRYRVKGEDKRSALGLRLADLYLLNGYYDEALNALIRTDSPNVNDAIANERQLKEAEILFAKKDYAMAADRLIGLDGSKAQSLRAEIAWEENQFSALITELEQKFDSPDNLPPEWGVEDNVHFVQLAVAYNSLGRIRDLERLKKRYKIELEADNNLGDIMNFLLREGGSEDLLQKDNAQGLWASLSTAFDSYHKFVNHYDALRDERDEEKINRKIFNRRMRQVSAPPRI